MKTVKVLFGIAFLASTIALCGCTSESAPAPQTPAANSGSSDAKPASSDAKPAAEEAEAASDDKGEAAH